MTFTQNYLHPPNKAKVSNKKAEQKAAANDAAINNAVNKAAA